MIHAYGDIFRENTTEQYYSGAMVSNYMLQAREHKSDNHSVNLSAYYSYVIISHNSINKGIEPITNKNTQRRSVMQS